MKNILDKFKHRTLRKQLRTIGAGLPKDAAHYNRSGSIIIEEKGKFNDVTFGTLEQGLLEPVQIGAHSYMGPGRIEMVSSIGRYCSIARHVVIGMDPAQHPTNWLSTHPFQYEGAAKGAEAYPRHWQGAVIGNDVWIGEGALIMKGVTVGHGAIIGAHSIVTKNVPCYAIVVGAPAKVLRYRFSDVVCEQLLKLAWWHASPQQLSSVPFHHVENAIKHLAARSDNITPYAPKQLHVFFGDKGISAQTV